MGDEEEEVLSCAGMFWIDAAKKMALDCCPCDVDSMPRSERRETIGDGTVLKREDMVVHGLCPARDEFFLVVCEQCQMLVKPQALAYHIAVNIADLRHRQGIGESHLAILSSTPSSASASKKRPIVAKPCASAIGNVESKSNMCRRRRSRRSNVKGRSRLAAATTQRQQFEALNNSLLPGALDVTPKNVGSLHAPQEHGRAGGLSTDLTNPGSSVLQRLPADDEPSANVVSGSSGGSRVDLTESKSLGRGIIVRFAHLNHGKGTWIAETGPRRAKLEQTESSQVLSKGHPHSSSDGLKLTSFNGVQTTDYEAAMSKGNEVPSQSGDGCLQVTGNNDLKVNWVMDKFEQRKPLASSFKRRKIGPEPKALQDSSTTALPFAHSDLFQFDRSVHFPLPRTGGTGFVVPALMPTVQFQGSYSSTETVVSHERHADLLDGFDVGGSDIGHRFDIGVSDIGHGLDVGVSDIGHGFDGVSDIGHGFDFGVSDTGHGFDVGVSGIGHGFDVGVSDIGPDYDASMTLTPVTDAVPLVTVQPSIFVPFCAQFAPECRIEAGSDGDRVQSLEVSHSRRHVIVTPPGSCLDPKGSIGTRLSLVDDRLVRPRLAQTLGLSGSHGNNLGTTFVTADLVSSVECHPSFLPWTRCAGEPIWNSGTLLNPLSSVQEHPLASSTALVVSNDSAQIDVSSSTDSHEVTSTCRHETLPLPSHCVSSYDDVPSFLSSHICAGALSHVEPPSTATHFSSKFHLTATVANSLTVGAQALTSAKVPCAQPWLCRIGANNS